MLADLNAPLHPSGLWPIRIMTRLGEIGSMISRTGYDNIIFRETKCGKENGYN